MTASSARDSGSRSQERRGFLGAGGGVSCEPRCGGSSGRCAIRIRSVGTASAGGAGGGMLAAAAIAAIPSGAAHAEFGKGVTNGINTVNNTNNTITDRKSVV